MKPIFVRPRQGATISWEVLGATVFESVPGGWRCASAVYDGEWRAPNGLHAPDYGLTSGWSALVSLRFTGTHFYGVCRPEDLRAALADLGYESLEVDGA